VTGIGCLIARTLINQQNGSNNKIQLYSGWIIKNNGVAANNMNQPNESIDSKIPFMFHLAAYLLYSDMGS